MQTNRKTVRDPLAVAAATPDVGALIDEFTYAMENGPAQLSALAGAEDVRYNRWAGKSPDKDGARWQKNAAQGTLVRPYDGRPDTDVNLADELLGYQTDLDLMALAGAQIGVETTHLNRLTAAQIAELTAVVRWLRKAIRDDTRDGAELLSQMKGSIGWAVLQVGWRETWGVVERTVMMEEVLQMAMEAKAQLERRAGGMTPDPRLVLLAQLPVLILDPTLEDEAVNAARQFLPAHLSRKQVRSVILDLRQDGTATYLDRQLEEKRPTVNVLIPGYNFFVSGAAKDLQSARGTLRVEFFFEAEVREMAVNAGWNPEFIEAVIGTMGMTSGRSPDSARNTGTDVADDQDKRIEIWTTEVRQFDEVTGVTGIYCTTFSPHLRPGAGEEADPKYHAAHYLLAYAHRRYPYVVARREVVGPALSDSRGVPEIVRADSKVVKKMQDSLGVRAEWEVNPATIRIGSGWSKTGSPLAPGADMTAPPGCEVKPFALDRGNPQVAIGFIEHIEKGTRRRFAQPNNGEDGGHPSQWQMRAARNSRRWLSAWEEMYWQLAVIAYQEFSAGELAQIIGRPPLLTVTELLRHFVTLNFESRGLDNEWRQETLATFLQLLSMDKGGQLDTAKLIRVIGSMTDPTLIDEVMRNPAGAQAELYRRVQGDVSSIILGNPPPLVEMDPTAGMQLEMAATVVAQNPKYQRVLAKDGQARENLKVYLQNLQHSQQETQLSPVQGRLGVTDMPRTPVRRGSAMAAVET